MIIFKEKKVSKNALKKMVGEKGGAQEGPRLLRSYYCYFRDGVKKAHVMM